MYEGEKLPSIKSSKSIIVTAARKKARNKAVRSTIKTYETRARKLIAGGDLETAKEVAVKATSILDRAARKRVIHPNNAARHKSRLMRALSQASKD